MTCLIRTASGCHKTNFQRTAGVYTVRIANKADIATIAEIERQVFSIQEYGTDVLDFRKIKRLIERGNSVFLVCENHTDACGYVLLLFRQTSSAGRLYSHAVLPQFQGKGVGSLLLSCAEELCLRHHLKTLLLEIRAENHTLRNRYLRRGYVIREVISGYYADGMDAIKLEGDLESIAAGK